MKENNAPGVIDDILDKIKSKGMESLTRGEKKTLSDYSRKGSVDMDNNLRKRLDGMKEFNPREDEVLQDMGMDFSSWSDDEIEKGRLNIIWNDLSEEDIEDFLTINKIDRKTIENEKGNLPGEIPDHLLDSFSKWIDDIVI
jgi:hypothetical protein